MNYYHWRPDHKSKKFASVIGAYFGGYFGFFLEEERELYAREDDYLGLDDEKEDLADCLHSIYFHCISSRLKAFLESRTKNIQFIQIPLRRISNRRIIDQKYYIMNSLKHVDCVDWELTPCEHSEGFPHFKSIGHWEQTVFLDSKKAGDEKLFMIDGLHWWVIREDLRNEMKKEGFIGPWFTNDVTTEQPDGTWELVDLWSRH